MSNKVSKGNLQILLDSGIISQEQYNEAIAKGIASSGKRAASGKIRVCPGTMVVPQMYFKNGKGVEDTEEMTALRQEFKALQEKYTVEVDAEAVLEDAAVGKEDSEEDSDDFE